MLDTDREKTLSFIIFVSWAIGPVLGITPRFRHTARFQTQTGLLSNKAMLDTDRKNTLSFVILVSRAIVCVLGIASRARHATVPNMD